MNKDCLRVSDGSFILCWLFPMFVCERILHIIHVATDLKGRVVAGYP